MKSSFRKILLALIVSLLAYPNIHAQIKHFITVDASGNGDFKSITEAVASLPMFNYERITIFIKNGNYREKIRINQDYITLEGESRENTIISFSQLRSDWTANEDSIGPAVINIYGDDIILTNLTIKNIQPEVGPHAFTIYGTGTRTIILNCSVTSNGADTVSLWNYKNGMYYHAGCYFEGSVDFVCPRGWCFIKDSKFYELKQTAAIWHAGGFDKNQKFVIKNSYFDGVNGFNLGRHHYEAQFYLIDCRFSSNMKDEQIFRVTYEDETRNRPFNWGPRYYYYSCTRAEGNFSWFSDNLKDAGVSLTPGNITAEWTFDNKWNPENPNGPYLLKKEVKNDTLLLYFNEVITVIGKPTLHSDNGEVFNYGSGAGSNTLRFIAVGAKRGSEINSLKLINSSKITGTIASIKERDAEFIIK